MEGRESPLNRRQVVTILVAAPIAIPVLACASRIRPAQSKADDDTAVRYSADHTYSIRPISVRVSTWPDADAAEAHRQRLVDGAGSNLPEGDFYQSEPVRYVLHPDLSTLPATAMGWHTTAGVAAYRTNRVLLTARREAIVWDLWLSGTEPEPVLDLASTIALDLTRRAVTDDLFVALPCGDDVPEGMFLVYRMSPEGTVDAQGTPIPAPSPEGIGLRFHLETVECISTAPGPQRLQGTNRSRMRLS